MVVGWGKDKERLMDVTRQKCVVVAMKGTE